MSRFGHKSLKAFITTNIHNHRPAIGLQYYPTILEHSAAFTISLMDYLAVLTMQSTLISLLLSYHPSYPVPHSSALFSI